MKRHRVLKDLLDIFLLFFFTVAIVQLLLSLKTVRRNPVLSFEGGIPFQQVESIAKKNTLSQKNKRTGHHMRQYTWTDSTNSQRITRLKLDKSAVKNEIKKFGMVRGMKSTLFMQKRGFKIIGRSNRLVRGRIKENITTIVDYRQIFDRNRRYFPELTSQLIDSFSGGRYNPLYDFLKFVQYIPYRRPPVRYAGRFIGKFFVPLVCLYEQYGDCDSKSLLLAEFLSAYPASKEQMGMLLIHGQGLAHAVLAIKRKPLVGMSSIFVNGSGYYILLEATYHHFAPGFVPYRVARAIKAGYIRYVPLN